MNKLTHPSLIKFIQNLNSQSEQTLVLDHEKLLSLLDELIDVAESQKPMSKEILVNFYLAFLSKHPQDYEYKNDIQIERLQSFLLNMDVSFPKNPKGDPIRFIEYLSNQLSKFLDQNVFSQNNKQIGYIIAVYLLTRAKYPIFNFDINKPCPFNLSEALGSLNQTRWYLAELIKSKVKDELENDLSLKKHYEFSSIYGSDEREDSTEVIVHWHELNAAIKSWSKSA